MDKAHKTMMAEEYAAMPIVGWHMVCRNGDGFDGVGVQFITDGDPVSPELREELCIILGWYEEMPNDELPGMGVRKAFRVINEALGVPEK